MRSHASSEFTDREPIADEVAGIAWWNALSDAERARWLDRAASAVPVDAWPLTRRPETKAPSTRAD